jgi:vacuolar protein-sorting-associated protein 4
MNSSDPSTRRFTSLIKLLILLNIVLITFFSLTALKTWRNDYRERAKQKLSFPAPKKAAPSTKESSNFLNGLMQIKPQKPKPIQNVMLKPRQKINWDSVVGLQGAKSALKEAVELPLLYAHLFQGTRRKPWTGILLYGPPGTGKSFLAKAAASEVQASFFSASAADIMSMYQGVSEQKVKDLFGQARQNKPSIIFIDEIDSLINARGGANENESSRRVKTEFLVQMDGVGNDQEGVLVMAATNTPWALDDAVIRRFVKRIYVGLPDDLAREQMLKRFFAGELCTVTPEEWKQLAQRIRGYSGADIAALANDALYAPVRKLAAATHVKKIGSSTQAQYEVCTADSEGAIKIDQGIPRNKINVPPIEMDDLLTALQNHKSSVDPRTLARYEEWTRQFGKNA